MYREFLENGVDVDSTLRYVGSFRYNDTESFQVAAAFVIARERWPGTGVHSIEPEFSLICPRCHNAEETSLHTFPTCP